LVFNADDVRGVNLFCHFVLSFATILPLTPGRW
jgi:hypothetical protein